MWQPPNPNAQNNKPYPKNQVDNKPKAISKKTFFICNVNKLKLITQI